MCIKKVFHNSGATGWNCPASACVPYIGQHMENFESTFFRNFVCLSMVMQIKTHFVMLCCCAGSLPGGVAVSQQSSSAANASASVNTSQPVISFPLQLNQSTTNAGSQEPLVQ